MIPFSLSASARDMLRGYPCYPRALTARALDQKNLYGA